MAVYFISSKVGDSHQDGSIECDKITNTASFNKVLDEYKQHIVNKYGYKKEEISVISFSLLS